MGKKITSLCIIVLLLLLTFPVVSSVRNIREDFKNVDNTLELPDLIGNIEIVEIDNVQHFKTIISNIGEGTADNVSIEVKLYPFGIYPLRGFINELLYEILPPPIYNLIYLPFFYLHINPLTKVKYHSYSPNSLEPGEQYITPFILPIDRYIDYYINEKICYIFEIKADYLNQIEESDETNNREVIRWWFPIRTDPPT